MEFKKGDLVKFKKFDELPDIPIYKKISSSNKFHKSHENKLVRIEGISFRNPHDPRVKVDCDESERFSFKIERFKKVNYIEVDDSLFQL